ncbi:MAG: hypothetical protein HY026_07945 [Deltaproteobacteria bacterium]|nr:hypothetical protein [Deltaproteobacteria bacterium]
MTLDNILKRAALMGIGIMSVTEEKLKELLKEVESRGEMSEKEGKDLLKDLLNRAEKEKKAIGETIKKGIKDYLAKVDIASREEFLKLGKRVHNLEEKVKELTKAMEE